MKAALYIGSISAEGRTAPVEEYLTVQHLSYACTRSRDEAGFPYGPVLTTILDFTIRLQLPEDSKLFHVRMHENSVYTYSFVFDPEFLPSGKKNIKGFTSALIVQGYVVDVEEFFDAKPDATGTSKQVEVRVKLLLTSITFAGKNQFKTLVLKQDPPAVKPVTPDTPSDEPTGGDEEKADESDDSDKKNDESGDTADETPTEIEQTFSKYALFIGETAPDTGLAGGITHSKSKTLKASENDTNSITVLLNSLSYHKKIYQPNEIKAVLSVTWSGDTPTHDTLVGSLLYKRAELKVVDSVRSLDQIIAKNYFVYKMKPCFKKIGDSSSLEVELQIFSLDKLATLDKFSKAHTAAKLGENMFKPELASFNIGGMTLEGDTSKMQFLGINENKDEMRIPYAVQYDESFYEFLQRITQRYGEYLYFEDGKLNIGLQPTTSNYSVEGSDTIINWALCDDLKARYYESILPYALDVQEEYLPYLSRKDKDTNVYLKTIDLPENSTLKFNDLIGGVIAKTTNTYYNPDMVAADERLSVIKKDGYSSLKDKYKTFEKILFEELFNVLKSTSLAGVLSALTVTETMRLIKSGIAIKNENDLYNKINIDDSEFNSSDQKNSDKLAQFASISGNTAFSTKLTDGIVNFTSVFYSVIRKMEVDVAKKAVFLEFGEHTQPFALGDKISIDQVDYVIIEIEGTANKNQDSFDDTQRVVAIPYFKKDILVPPVMPIPQIRKANPQRAYVVVSAFEPEKIGRIRIRYPWQASSDPASPWIRAALPFTTNGGGVNFRPEISDEAMIGYENGNIDKPYVIGYLPSPYLKQKWGKSALPDRGMMSKNGHSVIFNDGVDGSNFFYGMFPVLGTLKSYIPTVAWPDALATKKNQAAVDLVGGTTITDRYGLYKISASSDERNITLQSPMGDIAINAFTGIKIDAPNGDISISGKNVSIKAGNNITIESGGNLKNKYLNLDDAFEWIDTFASTASKVIEKALDITFLRSVLEVFLRPIDGTLKIKSNTFVMIEAGPGKVEVPRGVFHHNPKDYLTDDQITAKGNLLVKIKNTLREGENMINSGFDYFKAAYNSYIFMLVSYKLKPVSASSIISFNEILGKAKNNQVADSNTLEIADGDIHADAEILQDPAPVGDAPEQPKKEDFEGENADEDYNAAKADWDRRMVGYQRQVARREEIIQITQNYKEEIKQIATNLLRTMNLCRLAAASWFDYTPPLAQGQQEGDVYIAGILTNDDIKGAILKIKIGESEISVKDVKDLNLKADDEEELDNAKTRNYKIQCKRHLAYKILCSQEMQGVFKVKENLAGPEDCTDEKWAKFVAGIYAEDSLQTKVKNWAYKHYGKQWIDALDIIRYQNQFWDPKVKGQILFSDNATKTVSFARNGMSDANNVESITTRYEAELKRILGDIK
ncbi:MAG: phage baseplate assembly protein V [Bacteroidaceae bacterium]|nr:phage baseplate assembly protein V [Bacteroidaceae bacterium]